MHHPLTFVHIKAQNLYSRYETIDFPLPPRLRIVDSSSSFLASFAMITTIVILFVFIIIWARRYGSTPAEICDNLVAEDKGNKEI